MSHHHFHPGPPGLPPDAAGADEDGTDQSEDGEFHNDQERGGGGDSGSEPGRPTKKQRSSKYRGVSRAISEKKWRAQITANGKTVYLGTYNTEEEAARAYDLRVVSLRGRKAKTNFDLESYTPEIDKAEASMLFREGTLVGYKTSGSGEWWPAMLSASEDASIYMLSLRQGERNPLLLYIFGYKKMVWASQHELKPFGEVFEPNPPTQPRTLFDLALQEAFHQAAMLARGATYPQLAPRQLGLRVFANQVLDLESRLTDCSRKPQHALNTADERLLEIWRDEVRSAQSYRAQCDRLAVLESDLRQGSMQLWWPQQRVRWLGRMRAITSLWSAEQLLVELDRDGINWDTIPRGDLLLTYSGITLNPSQLFLTSSSSAPQAPLALVDPNEIPRDSQTHSEHQEQSAVSQERMQGFPKDEHLSASALSDLSASTHVANSNFRTLESSPPLLPESHAPPP